ncbi:MAG: DUF4416 family protein [Planctomycetes bacterium]|nr:DUF4416 family protein [Planctomycetota bacterium]
MTSPIQVEPVRLLVGAIYQPEGAPLDKARSLLESVYGPVEAVSPTWPFDLSDYYDAEMGSGLERIFWSFARPIPPETLPVLKQAVAAVERELRPPGAPRAVNLDPMLLDHQKIVLASFKGAGQKLYLGNGVWADFVLRFHKGSWKHFDWTFPDFRDTRYHAFLTQVRDRYLRERARI